ncbi:MAG: VOC family protein [Candidatus Hermodarchaeota archaeon]|nr:VOC family protein [Candidatus Hermodarchaeota archaeon]
MNLNFEGINQLGYVVKNAAETAEKYQSLFGANPAVVFESEVTNAREGLDGKAIPSYRVRFALVTLGELQLEFIQVLEGAPRLYTDFLDRCGEGLHHVGINVPDLHAAVDATLVTGFTVLWSGQIFSVPFAYLDTQDQLGTILELIEVRPPKPLGA